MVFSEPKITIDLAEYQSLKDENKNLKDQLQESNVISDEVMTEVITTILEAPRAGKRMADLDWKWKELGVTVVHKEGKISIRKTKV